jgi:hypothetical protein
MNHKYNLIKSVIFLAGIFCTAVTYAESPGLFISQDTSHIDTSDSGNVNIQEKDSAQSSVSGDLYKMLYNSIFIDTTRRRDLSQRNEFEESQREFLRFSGKRINKIFRRRVDIFGGSIHDTLLVSGSSLTRAADNFHIDTRDQVIFNNMLVAPGDTVNPYQLADNERIIRALPFIRDAKIIVIPVKDNDELVSLVVITKDVFSLGIDGSVYGPGHFKVNVYERNLFGQGWELDNGIHYNSVKSPKLGYDGRFYISNINGSFISGLFNYKNLFELEATRLSLSRIFLTPQTKYAGGIDLIHSRSFLDINNQREQLYSTVSQDYWVGRAFQLRDDSPRKNLTLSIRFYDQNFGARPQVKSDSNFAYHDNHLILAGIYFTRILHFESSLIRGFGHIEDIPYGYSISLTGGFGNTEFKRRVYTGMRLQGATFSDSFGYILGSLGAGSFFDGDRLEDGVVKLDWLYFTHLLNIGREYKLRQFISGNYTVGIRRLNNDQLDLLEERGIPIFESDQLKGVQRFQLSLETVTFSPWDWFGFRYAFEVFADFGWIGSNQKMLELDQINSAFGFIFRLRNEFLVFDTFEIGFAFFPNAPQGSKNFNWGFSTSQPQLFRGLQGRKPTIVQFN